ncbi:MAG: ABC transporter ATP-binding protein [Pelolinea sp.]|jgi:simple sugar transport system ATP-binding protein|nr:ABC transporter ATP-binding protein [Pelolinea sp.]
MKTSKELAVQMRGISKHFPGILANDGIDLDVYSHEILALLGENGAGKTTLMNILAGLYKPDGGQIFLKGREVEFHSPKDAIEHGIGMVHQHFMLVESLTVTENIILSLQRSGMNLHANQVKQRILELSSQYHLLVDPDASIWQLSVGEQQRVEIMRLLYRGAETLILDEPTAVLTPEEATDLAKILRKMADEGKAVILITHKLNEVTAFSDRVTVLRAGHVVSNLLTKETTKKELARLMVGRDILFHLEKKKCKAGNPVLQLEHVHATNDKGLPALVDVNLQICAGEILGVAGVAGNGQRELAEAIAGLRHIDQGKISANGQDITNSSPFKVISAGISHVPGDRIGVGLASNLPVSDNLVMKAYRNPPIVQGQLVKKKSIVQFVDRLINAFNIKTPSSDTPARLLSGGNQQRLILAREITASQGMLIAVYPSRGLDVGATESVRSTLLEQREKGSAILLISEDLEEINQLSDRVIVMYEGKIMGTVDPETTPLETIGLMMAGQPLSAIEKHGKVEQSA